MKVFAVGAVVLIVACSLPNVGLWSTQGKADTGLYQLYGSRIVHGSMPYRSGFSLEFPPGAIPALAVPALPRSHYVPWFHAFMLLCGIAAIGALAYARGSYGAAIVAGAAPAVLGPISLNALDLWPAALATWAVALTLRNRPRLGLGLLGAATAAKLYPALLAPVLLTYVLHTHGAREAKRAALAAVAVVAAIFLPFAAAAPGGLRYSLQEQATRGLQVESLGGSILGVAHRFGAGFSVVVSHAPFSFDIGGRTADVLATLLSFIVLVVAALAWQSLRRGPVDRARTLRAVAATAVAFVAFAKVLSPQFLLFLVPLVPLVESPLVWAVFLGALALTQVWARFPQPFLRTVQHLGPDIWVVLARNLVLVAFCAMLVTGLRRDQTDAGDPEQRSR